MRYVSQSDVPKMAMYCLVGMQGYYIVLNMAAYINFDNWGINNGHSGKKQTILGDL